MSVLLDSNVLLRRIDSNHWHHDQCQRLLEPQRVEQLKLVVCTQSLIEFWVVATRPSNQNGMGLSPEESFIEVKNYLKLIPCLEEPRGISEQWLQLVATYRCIGKIAHDARLVASALSHGISRLATLNISDFRRFTEIDPVTPEQLLGE